MESPIQILSPTWDGYALLDSGNGQKLERIAGRTVVRGETKAWWQPQLGLKEWEQAVAVHNDEGTWRWRQKLPESWSIPYGKLTLCLKMSPGSKHTGIFPEQEPNWLWLQGKLAQFKAAKKRAPRVLNLFGYTGVASLLSASIGAEVTHVDASKPAIAWARHNQELSGLQEAPIRWICDDARKFIKREIKRNRGYEAILLDPPSFGRGPNGEVWKAERDLYGFLEDCVALLSDTPICLLLTLYSLDASALMLHNLLQSVTASRQGKISVGELALVHEADHKRWLPLSLFGRWESYEPASR